MRLSVSCNDVFNLSNARLEAFQKRSQTPAQGFLAIVSKIARLMAEVFLILIAFTADLICAPFKLAFRLGASSSKPPAPTDESDDSKKPTQKKSKFVCPAWVDQPEVGDFNEEEFNNLGALLYENPALPAEQYSTDGHYLSDCVDYFRDLLNGQDETNPDLVSLYGPLMNKLAGQKILKDEMGKVYSQVAALSLIHFLRFYHFDKKRLEGNAFPDLPNFLKSFQARSVDGAPSLDNLVAEIGIFMPRRRMYDVPVEIGRALLKILMPYKKWNIDNNSKNFIKKFLHLAHVISRNPIYRTAVESTLNKLQEQEIANSEPPERNDAGSEFGNDPKSKPA